MQSQDADCQLIEDGGHGEMCCKQAQRKFCEGSVCSVSWWYGFMGV